MRHRITSFRCVEARAKMSLCWPQRKTCNDVNIRHIFAASRQAFRRGNPRQPAQFRPTAGRPAAPIRTTLNADPPAARRQRIEQRIEGRQALRVSRAGRGIEARRQALRLASSSRRCRNGAAALAGLAIVTRRVERAAMHRSVAAGISVGERRFAAVGGLRPGPVAADRRRGARDRRSAGAVWARATKRRSAQALQQSKFA